MHSCSQSLAENRHAHSSLQPSHSMSSSRITAGLQCVDRKRNPFYRCAITSLLGSSAGSFLHGPDVHQTGELGQFGHRSAILHEVLRS